MSISVFDLFSIGIGPSSSHTVGPMHAANNFAARLLTDLDKKPHRIQIDLYGSLALTGIGHGTDKALLNGLAGFEPDTVIPEEMDARKNAIIQQKKLPLSEQLTIEYNHEQDFLQHQKIFLPGHSNALTLTAFDDQDTIILKETYYSIGGGFILTEDQLQSPPITNVTQPYPFDSGAELLEVCNKNQFTIRDLMMANEGVWRSDEEIRQQIKIITDVMSACIDTGCKTGGTLPGGLQVKRRAKELHDKLTAKTGIRSTHEASDLMNHLNMYAMAVNEENAAGGRIVTAPTNGAAGVIPAVIEYYKQAHDDSSFDGIVTFFLTAAAIGLLYKKNASISGAEVGCQGEVGVASSMAAAGLTAALGGNMPQVENAAEIAMEHHLGMTCDPIDGLVQIPCIERNAMGAVKAVNATRMALIGDGQHYVSLDKVIKTMFATGRDMMTIYKETSQGGLAVNSVEC